MTANKYKDTNRTFEKILSHWSQKYVPTKTSAKKFWKDELFFNNFFNTANT